VLAAFMAGEGREEIGVAKRTGDGILERGRLLEQYGKSTNDAIKELVRRQNAATTRSSQPSTSPTRATTTSTGTSSAAKTVRVRGYYPGAFFMVAQDVAIYA
jgi:hypothetical protein